MSPEEVEALKKDAAEHCNYVLVDESEALEKYVNEKRIQKVYWTNSNGIRYTWGPDVINFATKYSKPWESHMNGKTNRKFLIPNEKFRRQLLKKPYSKGYAMMTTHVSHKTKGGWRLSRSDPHHILNFPPELLELICRFALVLPEEALITPLVITTNWKRHFSQPRFEIYNRHEKNEDPHEILRFNRKDDKGKYIQLRYLQVPAIDATFMRTCKTLHQIGSSILYGQNKFIFPTEGRKLGWQPSAVPCWFGGDIGEHRPSPVRPHGETWWKEVNAGIAQIQQRTPVTSLLGWIYYDPFPRFIHTIGPQNAAHIKSLTFSGVARIHDCSILNCGPRCPQDLVRSLRLYTPFIQQFFKGLQTLTIYPLQDDKSDEGISLILGRPKSLAEAMTRLLERSIMRI
ncbi:hypothetical protein GLAREA_06394 [Glarea lozoyensis ATCC 20868]|uniref:F-box domain-containing protein n=1 Tax=Glarea lozoyensis (strain ATCC 20868 / MF5171) TaxID=1116229 RepID=S3DMR5_GLAL2|nr:uncharacterized protein GLAREA_06394 [Glarea lozoyensis ATCC 20868]EPE33381.1 hypothetical protein GLAREA_06394 [Glarea lozoyensis ATCC 20868]